MRLLTSLLIFTTLCGIGTSQDNPLVDGELYKLEIGSDGLYSITGQWMADVLDLPIGSVRSDNLNILGVLGGPLRHDSNWEQTERLTPLSISVSDGGDDIINAQDKITFYAQGVDRWEWIASQWSFSKNPYTSTASYILKISDDTPVRIQEAPTNTQEVTNATSKYVFRNIYDEDLTNLLGADLSTQGSGQRWFGPELSNVREQSFSNKIALPSSGLTDAEVEVVIAGRSKNSERLSIRVQDKIEELAWSPVNTGDVEELYARIAGTTISSSVLRPDDPIAISYQKSNAVARLWLDYIKVTGAADIKLSDQPLLINNGIALTENKDGLQLGIGQGDIVWDVTNPLSPTIINVTSSSSGQTIATDDFFSEYMLFNEAMNLPSPTSGAKIDHVLIGDDATVDMIIIAPSALMNSAQRLQNHRTAKSNINVKTVLLQDIYDLYAAGRPDVTAIRNYLRDLYRSGSKLKYLLLFGDGTYDYRGIDSKLPIETTVPTFETVESLDPLFGFPSDDYFALLEDGENGALTGDMDIAIGRIPAANINEANIMVDKIIRYDLSENTKGAWKSNIAFLADDEDRNLHINDADRIAEEVSASYPQFNQEKIYFDAFQQESTAGGNRYPAATQKLNSTVDQGALVINYLGHGGPRGWSQERVLKVDDITSWTNIDRLPLVVTATCSFTGFDDPALKTAGELVMLNPVGGAVALFTTVRSVFASKNFRLTQAVFRQLFEVEQGQYLTIGEVMQRGKNSIFNDNLNGRKFFLIGDPSMRLAIPSYNIDTELINGHPNNASSPDTVGALDPVTIQGSILSPLGEVDTSYNGVLDIVVFDKPSDVNTLANDEQSQRRSFRAQTNVIYRGKASINEGKWSATFRVPIDIDYSIGNAKLSYYATSDTGIEAMGFSNSLVITGTSESPPVDTEGPAIDLFINSRSFSNGDIVGSNSFVIADLSDISGINISSAGIGHEITATLSGQETRVVTPFYTPAIDDPTGGVLSFDLGKLEGGSYELTIKAFDVLNNVGASNVSFEVSESVLANPPEVFILGNPHREGFLQYSINTELRISQVRVDISLYDATGRLVETHQELTPTTNGRILAAFEPKLEYSGTYIAQFVLRDRNGVMLAPAVAKKVIALK